MKGFLLAKNVLTVVLFALVFTSLAQAQASRTWVSGVGDDANPCSRTAPCKTFAGAISKTAAGGEIDCIDPGGFGAVTITKSITIDCAGTFGSILASSTNGIIVNDTTNVAIVRIRNLSIQGIGNGINGIRFLTGKELYVENVSIYAFSNNCIDVALTGSPSPGHRVAISNTTIENCTQNGIQAGDSSVNLTLAVTNSRIHAAGQNGIRLDGNVKASIRDSDMVFNGVNGVSLTQASAEAMIENNKISFNQNGVQASGGSFARVSNNHLTKNSVALSVSGGTINSFQNNKADGNTTNGSATNIGTGHGTI